MGTATADTSTTQACELPQAWGLGTKAGGGVWWAASGCGGLLPWLLLSDG